MIVGKSLYDRPVAPGAHAGEPRRGSEDAIAQIAVGAVHRVRVAGLALFHKAGAHKRGDGLGDAAAAAQRLRQG